MNDMNSDRNEIILIIGFFGLVIMISILVLIAIMRSEQHHLKQGDIRIRCDTSPPVLEEYNSNFGGWWDVVAILSQEDRITYCQKGER